MAILNTAKGARYFRLDGRELSQPELNDLKVQEDRLRAESLRMTAPNSFAAQQVPGASGQQPPPLAVFAELEHRQALELLRQVHDSLNPQASRQYILSEPIPFFNGKLVPGWFLVMLGFMFGLIPAVIVLSLYPRRFTDELEKKRWSRFLTGDFIGFFFSLALALLLPIGFK